MSLFNLIFGPTDKDNHLYGLLDLNSIFSSLDNETLETNAIATFDTLFFDIIKKSKDEEQQISRSKFPLSYKAALALNQIYCSEQEQV
jgi:hypothetical protein